MVTTCYFNDGTIQLSIPTKSGQSFSVTLKGGPLRHFPIGSTQEKYYLNPERADSFSLQIQFWKIWLHARLTLTHEELTRQYLEVIKEQI